MERFACRGGGWWWGWWCDGGGWIHCVCRDVVGGSDRGCGGDGCGCDCDCYVVIAAV